MIIHSKNVGVEEINSCVHLVPGEVYKIEVICCDLEFWWVNVLGPCGKVLWRCPYNVNPIGRYWTGDISYLSKSSRSCQDGCPQVCCKC